MFFTRAKLRPVDTLSDPIIVSLPLAQTPTKHPMRKSTYAYRTRARVEVNQRCKVKMAGITWPVNHFSAPETSILPRVARRTDGSRSGPNAGTCQDHPGNHVPSCTPCRYPVIPTAERTMKEHFAQLSDSTNHPTLLTGNQPAALHEAIDHKSFSSIKRRMAKR